MEKDKIALCPCNGMSPYGLIARAACSDTIEESSDIISICITATSADKEGFRDIIKKYPIIAVNGCENSCVDKILAQKGVKTVKTLNIMKLLNEEKLQPADVARLRKEDEKCVEAVKNKRSNGLIIYNQGIKWLLIRKKSSSSAKIILEDQKWLKAYLNKLMANIMKFIVQDQILKKLIFLQ